jgi:hypothetical protein
MPYRYANNVGKQTNEYPKVVDEMVDEAFAKSNPTTLSAKYFAAKIKILGSLPGAKQMK